MEKRAFCAIMLRKALTQSEPNLWSESSAQTQANIKQELMNALVEEQQKTVVKKVGDTISELAADLLPKNLWPELLPALNQLVAAGNPAHMQAALNILANLASFSSDCLRPHLGGLHPLLGGCLQHRDIDVQVAALLCVANLIQSLNEASEREAFQPMVPAMLSALGRCLQGGEENSAQEVLEALIEVAENHPKFLRRHLAEVVSAMLQIATAAQLEASTRVLASEFLVTLCEARDKAPGMVRKLPNFVSNLFEALMGFLLDIEDEPQWHEADTDQYEEEGNGELFDDGQEALDRMAISLGGKALVPAAANILPIWLNDQDWRKRHASLICLAQIAEGCAKVMSTSMDSLVGMCLRGLQDPHPKVRWAACQALGQMCTDLGPDLQEAHGTQILPVLLGAMDDFSNPRVQAHASAAVVNFSEGCDTELMAPFLDALIGKLLVLLQQGKRLVQEGALTAMASVADCSQEEFKKYYEHVMPLLSSILLGAQDKEHRLLRAKALECISLVGMAVGVERFRSDAQHVMNFLQQLHGTELEPDDPTSSYMLQAGARLCKTLGPEFLPYLSIVMPPLLKSAQLEPDVAVHDGDVDYLEDEGDDDVEHIQYGDKILAIRTSTMEEKATACNMICCYADELKEGFFPYVQQVADIMVPLLKFYFHEEVRRAAVQSLPQLLRSAQAAAEKGVTGANADYVLQLLNFIWEPAVLALKREPEPDVQASMLDALAEVVDLVEPGMLNTAQVEGAFGAFSSILAAAESRRSERAKRAGAEDFDEEEAEALEEENEAEEELFDQVGTCLGNFLKKFGDAVLPYVEGLMPSLAPLMMKTRPEEERRIAMCIIDDILEHSAAGRAKYAAQLLPMLLEECMATHADLRQCAVYGVCTVATKSPDIFKPQATLALTRVSSIIQHAEARSDDNEMATDNAISALAALMEHHSDVLDGMALGDMWVGSLPVKADAVEACKNHDLLLRLVEAQDQRVLGAGNKNLPHIANAVVQILGRGTKLISTESAPRLVALHNHLKAQLPQVVEAAYAALKEKHKVNYNAFMEGKVPQ